VLSQPPILRPQPRPPLWSAPLPLQEGIVVFDQVLNDILLIAIVFILVPTMIIAAVLMITGRRKQHH
jgi:hypothetical protein